MGSPHKQMAKYEIIIYWTKRTRPSLPKFQSSMAVPRTARLWRKLSQTWKSSLRNGSKLPRALAALSPLLAAA